MTAKPKKHKHFNVFSCYGKELEDKLNEIYQKGFNVVQVVPSEHGEFHIITIRIPRPGDLLESIDVNLQNIPEKI